MFKNVTHNFEYNWFIILSVNNKKSRMLKNVIHRESISLIGKSFYFSWQQQQLTYIKFSQLFNSFQCFDCHFLITAATHMLKNVPNTSISLKHCMYNI